MNSKSRPNGDSSGKPANSGGWRQQKRGATSSAKYWQSPTSRRGRDSVFLRRLKLSTLGLLFIGLLLYFTIWNADWARPVDVAAFAITAYRSPIPPNSLASEDIFRIDETLGKHGNFDCQPPQQPEGRAPDFLKSFADRLASMRCNGPTVFNRTAVIYLSGHGVINDQGEACILTSEAEPHQSDTWLPMSDVFLAIKNAENLANANILLLLDAGRIRECWPLGVFHNGFSKALHAAVVGANDDRIYVINSTSDGQRGWSAPEMSATPFGYYCTAGLWGAANKSGNTINLQEFFQYVRGHVDGFAREHRNSTQTPELISTGPEDADFPIAYDAEKNLEVSRPLGLENNRPQQLSVLWQRFAKTTDEDDAYCFEPHLWAETAHNLTRLEELMIAGSSYNYQFAATATTVDSDLDLLRAARTQYAKASHSVALLRCNDLVDGIDESSAAANAWKDSLANPKPENRKPMPVVKHPVAATIAWDWFVNGNGSRADLETDLQLVESTHEPLEVSEVQLMRMLDKDLDWQVAGRFVPEVLEAQELSERAAAPYDIRSHYWTSDNLQESDRKLRAGRDRLLANAPPAVASLSASYDQAIRRQKEITEAFRWRDYALAVGPHFARWALTSKHLGPQQNVVLRAVNELIPSLHKLSEELDRAPAQDQPIMNLAPVREHLELLQNAFDVRNRELYEKGKDDQVALAEINALLSIPILPRGSGGNLVARYRNELRQRLIDYRWKPAITLASHPAESDQAVASENERGAYPLQELTLHPALAMFRREEFGDFDFRLTGGQGVSSNVESLILENGTSLRNYLADIQPRGKRISQTTFDAFKADVLVRPQISRQGLSYADGLYRAAAALVVGEPWRYIGDDYSQSLRRLDQHFFWLWHGERATKDLWADTQPGESFYFSRLGNAYRRAARELFVDGRRYQAELEQSINRGIRQMNEWRPVQCAEVRILGNTAYNNHRTEFQPLPTGFGESYSIQDGQVAVAIERYSGKWETVPRYARQGTASTRRSAVGVMNLGDKPTLLDYRLKNEDVSDAEFLHAVALFRGHRFEVPFGMGKAASLVYQAPDLERTNVTVHGDGSAQGQIIFILDCSYSMVTKKIFADAKKALKDVLRGLNGNSNSVGLYAYGHRAGFKSSTSDEIRRAAGAPNNLQPGDDVERLVPIDRLANVQRTIMRKVDALQAMGVTPLWYACRRAISDLDSRTGLHRRVIAITDGENNQEPPVNMLTNAGDVWRACKDSKVKLDLLGYQFAGNAEIVGLVNKSDGLITFTEAKNAVDLSRKIQSSLETKYTVSREGFGSDVSLGGLRLEETWTRSQVSPPEFVAGIHTVRLSGNINTASRIELLGGEGLHLYYDDLSQILVHRRFRSNLRKEVDEVTLPGSQQKFFVGVHMPEKRVAPGAVSLQISVQNSDAAKFSRRPRLIWCEIRPVMSNGEASTETFFCGADQELVPNAEVPLFRYTTAGWPADAFAADLQFWFKLQSGSPATENLTLGDERQRIDNLVPGSNFTVKVDRPDAAVRIVVEESPSGNSPLVPTWVQLSPPARSVRRTVDPVSRIVRHVFMYPDATALRAGTVKLQAFPRSEIDTWAKTGNLRIEVPNQ